jgi:glycosyltransferase involved in cell wall biosynthesis
MEPLVSILIPAYNAEKWITNTIESALNQTWRRKEIIVVDDGSSDQTLAFAQKFACGHLTVLTQPNAGAATARNKAFSVCQGDYIQWLDADDLLGPEKISRQMAAAALCASEQALLSCAWGHFIFRPHKAIFNPSALWADLAPLEWVLRNLGHGLWMQPANWLVSRKISEAAGPWDVRLSLDDDGEYFSRVVLASEIVRFVPEAKIYYRRTPASLSYVGGSSKKLESLFLSIRLQIEHARAVEDTPRVRKACVNCLQKYLVWFYPERPDIVVQAGNLANELGEKLDGPHLPLKYAWIQKVFGWSTAKQAQAAYNYAKLSVFRSLDKALSRLESSPRGNLSSS